MLSAPFRMTYGQPPPPTTANEWVRANVRELMDFRRITQAELADMIGQSQPWLSKRLTGVTEFQMGDLDLIANAFGLSPAQLLCAGTGQWERRSGQDRRNGSDRRRKTPFGVIRPERRTNGSTAS